VKHLENLALTASKFNKNLRVHVVCSGLPYGHGEANDVFYEFFRRAWLSLHPDLASLPVIGKGDNNLPTIHVEDLSRFVQYLADDSGKSVEKQYLLAVDQCKQSTQREMMKCISESLGSGAIKNVQLDEVIDEDWAEMLTLDLKMETSSEFVEAAGQWHCKDGITNGTMKLLNEEFNLYRGLFPLKVYIGGPPGAGKSHFAKLLAESYGIPHLTIQSMVDHAQKLDDELGEEVRGMVEQLKQEELAAYEKTRKKKDPDLDPAKIKVRFPDEMVNKFVKAHIGSPACMNKGFILDGYPRNAEDAKAVFLNLIPGYGEEPEDGAEEEQKQPEEEGAFPGFTLDERILPQYTIVLEADSDALKAKLKELPVERIAGTHLDDANIDRRLKIYRDANPTVDDEKHIVQFFEKLIGQESCKLFDDPEKTVDVNKTVQDMKELLEQNGKPSAINLITDVDNKFLRHVERQARKEAQAAADAEKPGTADPEASHKGVDDTNLTEEEKAARAEEEQKKAHESESEEDEVGALIEREEQEARRAEQQAAEQKIADEEAAKEKAIKDKRDAEKLEKIREQERDLLDKRSQPIRQYLMDNVVPHLTEGLINLCKAVPDDPTDYLANFLNERADQVDEEAMKKRDEEIRRKAAEKNGNLSQK